MITEEYSLQCKGDIRSGKAMETERQDSKIKIRECVVKLERLEMDINDDSSDSTDLPFLFATTRKKTRSKKASKSSAELLKEHQSLAQNIKGDSESDINIEETIRKLEIVQIEHIDDRSSVTSDPPPCEDNDVKIFCVVKSLQFFNARDVTPAQCGYENRCHDSFPVHIFEQTMLSFKWAQFQHVISSFLYSAKEGCISDCKSFVTFLLKTISIHSDTSCVSACYRVLVSLMDNHPDSFCLTFTSAEIFMLLFNYGIDIDNFKFLSKWTDIKRKLEVPQYPNAHCSGIPDQWLFNLKFILKSLIKISSSCSFKGKDIERIIIFLMWMSTDPFLLRENLYSTVRQCIKVFLDNVKEEKWNKIQCCIINDLMSLELPSPSTVQDKWSTICEMTESIPNQGTRYIQLRKQISFNSLKCLLGSSQDLEENCIGFSINELQFVIQELGKINSNLLKYASKFVDNCVKNLCASKEEYNIFCDSLKLFEKSLSNTAQTEKTQFLKIYARLRTFCGQKVPIGERSSMCNWIEIKSECDNNKESSESDCGNSPYDSEINDKGRNSFTPGLSEKSQNYDTNQSSSSNENSNEVHVKSEYMDQPCSPETARKASSIKLVLRKKRSSRSSSGNSLVDPSLETSDLNCEDDNLSRQSSEFECQLLNDDLSARNVVVQNTDDDLVVPGPDFVVSQDFSVEYPEETCNSIKVEPEQYYDHGPMSSEVEKMDFVDNEDHRNELSSTSENYVNESLFADDLSPLPEICEVKSIAFSSMDIENSSVPVSDLPCESTNNMSISEKIEEQPSFLEASHIGDNAMLFNNEISVLHNESGPEIIAYEAVVLNDFSFIQENIDNIPSKQTTSSTPVHEDNCLDADEDIVFIEETVSCKKSKTDHTEENIPSPIQRYSEALPEISITPVKNVPPSVPCRNNLTENEDIIIIEEKTPVKEKDPDVIFLKKIASPSQSKSRLSPKTTLRTNITTENVKTHINDKMPTKLNIVPQVEVSKSYIRSQENNSDNDDIVIIDEKKHEAITPKENKSSKNLDNHVISSNNKAVVDISHVANSESPSHQCKEASTSVLKQVDLQKCTFDSQCSASNLQYQDAMLKQTDKKIDIFGSNINEVLNSVIKDVDKSLRSLKEKISNSCGVDSYNEHLVLDDKNSHSTKKSIADLKNESSISMIDLSAYLSTVENNLEIGKESVDESSENVISSHTISNNPMKFTNKVINDKSDTSTNSCLNSADIPIKNIFVNVDDKNDKCSSGVGAIGLMNEICVRESQLSSQNFTTDLQNSNNGNISDIGNQAMKDAVNNVDDKNGKCSSGVGAIGLMNELCVRDSQLSSQNFSTDLQNSNNNNISDIGNQAMKDVVSSVSVNVDDKNDKCSSGVGAIGLMNEICIRESQLSSQNFTTDLQNSNNDNISDIVNQAMKDVVSNVYVNVDDKNDKCSSGVGAIGLMNEICVKELQLSSQNFTTDLQNSNNNNISDIGNQESKDVEACLNAALAYASHVTYASKDLVKSPFTTNGLISECGIDCECDVNDLQESNNGNNFCIDNQSIENSLNTALTYASKDLVKSVATNRLISECGVAKQTPILGTDLSKNISGSLYSDSEKSNSDILDNDIENQNVDKLTVAISDNNVKTYTVPVGEQIHVSETNPSLNIIPDSLACSVSKKSDSSVLDNNEIENQNANKLVTVNLDTIAKDCRVPPIHSVDDSLLQNDNENSKVSGNYMKNFKRPLKGSSPVSDENKVPRSSNAKIRLDRDINEMLRSATKKTLRNRKRTRVSFGKVAKKSLGNMHEIQVVKIRSGNSSLKTNTSSYVSPSSSIRRKRSLSHSYESDEDIIAYVPRKSPRKYSPVKSPLSAKYSSPKSPKHFFDYSHMRRKNVCFKRTSLLSDAGLNLTNVLRERIDSSSTSNQQNNESNNDDLDIIQLYTDPKRYADKECLIVYEAHNVVIVDSD